MHKLSFLGKRLFPFFIFFVALELVVRIALSVYSRSDLHGAGFQWPEAFFVGFCYDIVVFLYIALPISFYIWVLPAKVQGSKTDKTITSFLFFIFAFAVMFSAAGEWFFWDEFQARYNFIAVDYLIYTTEVIGNIQESYPVGILISLMALFSCALSLLFYRFGHKYFPAGISFTQRSIGFATLIFFTVFAFLTMSPRYSEISKNRVLNEIAGNGIYGLFSAYLNNELNYYNFYQSLPESEVTAFIKNKLGSGDRNGSPLYHRVENSQQIKKYNLVFITVESLSASFLTEFGNKENLTPHLDALSNKSLFFTNLYATGTRTVYGLSALTLSMPPVPGNSIVRRPGNDNLYTIGNVLSQKGYVTKFIYGGYGYFDNMNKFFDGNGYQVIDRNNLSKDEIHFANVWGVADNDLYARVIKENDEAYSSGKPFFDMIMTTSNHRPFTYPDGKIDIPSHSGRKGGVKFTDYTINEFLNASRKKPWFKNTIFVIVADHTASSAGKTELDPSKYHIPLWIYAPSIVKPQRVNWMASQIDVVPTILGIMNVNYDSYFYGRDLLKEKPERAFISNYQKLGYLTKEGLVILEPVDKISFFKPVKEGYEESPNMPENLRKEAIGYYQSAAEWKRWDKRQSP